MVCDDLYFMCKTALVEFLQPMQNPSYISIYIVVEPLNTR